MIFSKTNFSVMAGACGILFLVLSVPGNLPVFSPATVTEVLSSDDAGGEPNPVPLAVARDRAKLMHTIYAATLDSLHHHFFRRDRSVLPARAMEDIFAEVDRQSKIKSRWIAVNTTAMSVNHEPKTAFEKKAAAEITAGKTEFEQVDKGYYYRAGSIPLGSGCVGCHTAFFSKDIKTPRFAGLVIAIPVKE